jgi:hypothetical protein
VAPAGPLPLDPPDSLSPAGGCARIHARDAAYGIFTRQKRTVSTTELALAKPIAGPAKAGVPAGSATDPEGTEASDTKRSASPWARARFDAAAEHAGDRQAQCHNGHQSERHSTPTAVSIRHSHGLISEIKSRHVAGGFRAVDTISVDGAGFDSDNITFRQTSRWLRSATGQAPVSPSVRRNSTTPGTLRASAPRAPRTGLRSRCRRQAPRLGGMASILASHDLRSRTLGSRQLHRFPTRRGWTRRVQPQVVNTVEPPPGPWWG